MTSQKTIGILVFLVYLANGHRAHFKRSRSKLELVHVVFRHGDRNQNSTYPNDPYQNNTFYPEGLGQLTNPGKIREYKIGEYLRKRYGHFLGDTYFPGILQANTSPSERCQASLQLVLAALFPPSSAQRWSSNLNWQPIPYDCVPVSENFMFWAGIICSKCEKFLEAHRNSAEYKKSYKPYDDVLNYIQAKSGIATKDFLASSLYSILKSQQGSGLKLPEWSGAVWPEPMSAIAKIDWGHMYAVKEIRDIEAGFLMSKILNDTKLFIKKDPSVKNRKLYLYSGHDKNIAAVLTWIGAADLEIPQYGAFIIFEVRNNKGFRFLKIFHQNYEHDTPQVINVPGCGLYCPWNKFIKLYSRSLNRYDLCN